MEHVNFDYQRQERTGIPEAVFAAGKPFPVLLNLFSEFSREDASPILFTRVEKSVFEQIPEEIRSKYDYDELSRTAFCKPNDGGDKPAGSVAIVSAGSADSAVVWECARTLRFMNVEHKTFEDCGVAGLWRIQRHIAEINKHNVIVCVAGMEAALASVLAGLTPRPIIGCPTSTGYGICGNGTTAMLSMLACCSPGISVVNIDNGFGAACVACKFISSFQGSTHV